MRFSVVGRREGEATFTDMGMALFHAKREVRIIHDSFVVTASHFVISQTTLLAHGVLVLAALARTCRMHKKDWRLEHREKSKFTTRPTQRHWADSGIAALAFFEANHPRTTRLGALGF
jgi:hypothetical protein